MLCKVTHDTGHISTTTRPRIISCANAAGVTWRWECYNKKSGRWALKLIPGLMSCANCGDREMGVLSHIRKAAGWQVADLIHDIVRTELLMYMLPTQLGCLSDWASHHWLLYKTNNYLTKLVATHLINSRHSNNIRGTAAQRELQLYHFWENTCEDCLRG